MGNIPSAKPSPRIENGVLKWYVGDTFTIQLELELTDQDGEEIVIGEEDTVTVKFIDDELNTVKEFNCSEIPNNTIELAFDEDVTALFHKGKYSYDIYYSGENRTTICNDNKAEVE